LERYKKLHEIASDFDFLSGHKVTVSVSELQNVAVDLALNYKNNLNTIKISEILSFKQQYQYFLIQN